MNTIEIENDTEMYDKIVSHFEKQLDRTNYWLSFAEAKNGAVIAVNVALMAVLVEIFDKAPVFCVVAMCCFLVSCGLSLISFIPNTNSRPDVEKSTDYDAMNLLFYGDIALIGTTSKYIELSINRYFTGVEPMIGDKIVYDLASNVLINSRIAMKKYGLFKWAVKVDLLAIAFVIIFLCAA